MTTPTPTLEAVKRNLAQTLRLGDEVDAFDASTELLGSIPELDSMAVVAVITGLEDEFGIEVDDDEISAETFETLGNLVAFVDGKLGRTEAS